MTIKTNDGTEYRAVWASNSIGNSLFIGVKDIDFESALAFNDDHATSKIEYYADNTLQQTFTGYTQLMGITRDDFDTYTITLRKPT